MRFSHLYYLFLACAALVMIGCAVPGKSIMVDPQAVKMDYSSRTLAFYPIPATQVDILNPDDVKDDYKDDEREPSAVVADSFYVAGCLALQRRLEVLTLQDPMDHALSIVYEDSTMFFRKSLIVYADSLPTVFIIPTEEAMRLAGYEPDIVLVIDSLRFDKTTTYSMGMMMMAGGGMMPTASSQTYLDSDVRFVLWDYWQDKAISWGYYNASQPVMFVCTNNTWRSLYTDIIRQALSKTTFYRSTY